MDAADKYIDTCHRSVSMSPLGHHSEKYKQGYYNGWLDGNSGAENDDGTYRANSCKK
jgi:hypothetical protein